MTDNPIYFADWRPKTHAEEQAKLSYDKMLQIMRELDEEKSKKFSLRRFLRRKPKKRRSTSEAETPKEVSYVP